MFHRIFLTTILLTIFLCGCISVNDANAANKSTVEIDVSTVPSSGSDIQTPFSGLQPVVLKHGSTGTCYMVLPGYRSATMTILYDADGFPYIKNGNEKESFKLQRAGNAFLIIHEQTGVNYICFVSGSHSAVEVVRNPDGNVYSGNI